MVTNGQSKLHVLVSPLCTALPLGGFGFRKVEVSRLALGMLNVYAGFIRLCVHLRASGWAEVLSRSSCNMQMQLQVEALISICKP